MPWMVDSWNTESLPVTGTWSIGVIYPMYCSSFLIFSIIANDKTNCDFVSVPGTPMDIYTTAPQLSWGPAAPIYTEYPEQSAGFFPPPPHNGYHTNNMQLLSSGIIQHPQPDVTIPQQLDSDWQDQEDFPIQQHNDEMVEDYNIDPVFSLSPKELYMKMQAEETKRHVSYCLSSQTKVNIYAT